MLVQMGFSPVDIAFGYGMALYYYDWAYCHQAMDAQIKIADRLECVDWGEKSGA